MKNIADYTVYSDGGSRGNPGQASYGYVIFDHENNLFHQEGKALGIATNNVAEYMGILAALTFITKNIENRPLNVACLMDSMLASQQLSGNWKIKNEQLRSLYYSIKQLENTLGTVTYSHIPREKNKQADALVNQALDEKSSF